jgi:Zn-dependent protease with chaperone function
MIMLKVQAPVGILSYLVCLMYKVQPFPSGPLDKLAEKMSCKAILKRSPLQRYYKVRVLQACSLSYNGIVLFDTKYLETLSPDEFLAVGAHEFTHIIKKHGIKRFCRMVLPAIILAPVVSLTVLMNKALLLKIGLLSQIGITPIIEFSGVFSFIALFILCLYINAPWNRQRETECDINAAKYTNREAMISALNKGSKIRPSSQKGLIFRLSPRLYPSLGQRMKDIRLAIEQEDMEPRAEMK